MQQEQEMLKFPQDFLWGVATSAYQIEGGITNDWSLWEKKIASKQADFYRKVGPSYPGWGKLKAYMVDPANYICGNAAEHWSRWPGDYQLLGDLNLNAYRFSIEWARIEPHEGEFDEEALDQYAQMIANLRISGITPFVTLWHFTFPVWIAELGGWENPQTVEYFDRFAQKVVTKFSDITNWITINEPEIYTRFAYFVGNWPPGRRNVFKYFGVINNLIEANKKVARVIRQTNPKARIGIAKNNTYFQPYKDLLPNKLLAGVANWWWNKYFLNRIHQDLDFIGLNYYHHRVINTLFRGRELDPYSDMNMELAPYGIYHTLMDLKEYNLPIYITENGLADSNDDRRQWFIKQTLVNMHAAIEKGVDVKGYFHWSLLDNFEWDFGFWPKFGLYEVDRKTMQRSPRPSAAYYAQIAASNQVEL